MALVVWARYVDRRPLSEYGVSASPRWVLDAVVGFGAWLALGSWLGGTTVSVSLSYPGGALALGLAVLLVALALHAAVQQLVFFRVVLENGAEGLHGRGVAPSRAALGALAVATSLFVGMHGVPTGLRALDLVVAGAVFGLAYLHTGELALGIGMHFGALYGGSVLFSSAAGATPGPAVFRVTGSLPGVLGVVGRYGFPRLVVAHLLVVAWLRWRWGAVSVRGAIAERADR